jgi:6-pyruvoyl-tetrahydropterin synthase
MIAHSLPDKRFGPAQKLHGATYVVDAEFKSKKLNDLNIVIDIGEASDLLKKVLDRLNYKNLDDLKEFHQILTTTEFLAWFIHQQIRPELPNNISLKIVLHESHVASASYEE